MTTFRGARVLAALVLLVVSVGAGLAVARATLLASERSVSIGAHEAVVRPTLDGTVVLDAGPLLPRVRLPLDSGPLGLSFGADIRLGDSDARTLDEVISNDAVIASQPEGEIAAVRGAIEAMALRAVVRGAAVGLVVAIGAVVVWRSVRAALPSADSRRARARLVGVASIVVVAGGIAAVTGPAQSSQETRWIPLREVFPGAVSAGGRIDPVLSRLELADGAAVRSGRSLIEGGLRTYRESQEFYDRLERTARSVEVRRPEPGQTTALVVTDRHDNIAMDPVARRIAEAADASLLLDLGDDTSNGADWEDFSINSLAREFRGYDVVAIAGNHDQGSRVPDQMRDRGFEVLDGRPVTIGGVRFVGDSDPRASGLTAGYTDGADEALSSVRAQDAALTRTACEDGRVAVALVHSAASARQLARSGCVDLVLAGHLHRQVGPDVVAATPGAPGGPTTVLTTGTTGGAIYAFALGTGLRRDAQVTLVTFEDGRPVGLQVVDIVPGGQITAQPWTPLALGAR